MIGAFRSVYRSKVCTCIVEYDGQYCDRYGKPIVAIFNTIIQCQFNEIQFQFNEIQFQFNEIQVQFNKIQFQFNEIQVQFNEIQVQFNENSISIQ